MQKRPTVVLLLSLLLLSLTSCNTTPTTPLTGNPNGPIFLAAITRQALDGSVTNTACQVNITTAQMTPIAGCSVTLVAPGPVTVVLAEGATGYFDNVASTWSYQPGQTYTFNVRANGTNYSGNIQLPGAVTVPAAGTPVSWTHEGTADTVVVLEASPSPQTTYNSFPGTTNANSPVNLSSAFPDVPGTYTVQVNVVKVKTSAFGSGAHLGASITGTDQYMKAITK